jgi:hypothetical protein
VTGERSSRFIASLKACGHCVIGEVSCILCNIDPCVRPLLYCVHSALYASISRNNSSPNSTFGSFSPKNYSKVPFRRSLRVNFCARAAGTPTKTHQDSLKPLAIALAAALDRGANFWPINNSEMLVHELRDGSTWAIGAAMYHLFGILHAEWNGAPHPWFWERHSSWRVPHIGDAADDLASWPLPGAVRKSGLSVDNFLELLTLFAGAPQRIADLEGRAKAIANNLVIFGAAHLTKATDTVMPLHQLNAPPRSQPNDHLAICAIRRGLDWLAAQMPRIAFPTEIEAFIGNVSDLKYRSDQSTPNSAES